MNVITFDSPEQMFEAMFGPSQQDEHVRKWRWAKFTNIFTANEKVGNWYLQHHGAGT